VPDPLDPDPRLVAEGLVAALERAHMSGRPVRVKLHAVPLRAGEWRGYTVAFDPARGCVTAAFGAEVDARGAALRMSAGAPKAAVATACRLHLQGPAEVGVTAPDGASLLCVPGADGRVTPVCDPWRRAWTHSLLCAVAAGALGALLLDGLAGVIVAAVMVAHAIADSVGYEGAALLYPWRRRERRGLCRVRCRRTLPNLVLLWGGGALTFWNLQCAGVVGAHWRLAFTPYLLGVIALPLLVHAAGPRVARIFVDRSPGSA
jgi:hypothetical protein